ncbi:MAG: hypothetical protein A2Z91_08205 [Deltaproteobacteria bacterium GWA2_38_16]|nr:MAG: hypothetical protein A2Z91_08205 [Deltaproteobacteria bacterium GWA2_38_16]OGQ01888.1 MAG: hypothetical protein A3D19_03215 [Deltaproteobacteria bacterium RIFCSPHIGHO2_02_FULL_38_15]OGQ29947.1 MAG: hypothetical protein A3A72_05885 [Deltaproteobacteria bacterium RIFCSPLOWO2_01_FULL_38_9]OGQ60026.1 MAG: hypothetical protein A3G92_04410 [Deltaproteobacteria bacterium RIFCSPLOWO2_12_FULL_38_8]HBQ20755.1 hypothetical protein [Deltaproteobacteria bacterium]
MFKYILMATIMMCPTLGFGITLDDVLGNWSGFYRDATTTKSYASSLSVIKTDTAEYLGDWTIQVPAQTEFGLSTFYIEKNESGVDEIYSCEQETSPERCTYWTFKTATTIRGERYEAQEGQAPKYIGYFYYKK